MRRGSVFHGSLNRPQLYAGIPKLAFLLIALGGCFCFVAKIYAALPAMALLWAIAKWLTSKDPAWVEVLEAYMREGHVYDAIPRPKDHQRRPEGWGKNLPW